MAARHLDNFSAYGGVLENLLDGVYAQYNAYVDLTADPDGVSPGWVLQIDFATGFLRWVMPVADATLGVANRLWMNNLPVTAGTAPTYEWRNGSNQIIAYCRVTTTGGFEFYRRATPSSPASDVLVASTSVPAVTASGWYHLEAKLVCGIAADATFELRVEGVAVLTATGFSTSSATSEQFAFIQGGSTGGITYYHKDIMFWDGTGTYNTDFVGSVIITDLLPASDVDLNWTPSTGTDGYSILDNAPPNDAIYLAAGDPPPLPYVCTLSDLPADVTSVKAVMTMVRAAKIDGGDASLQIGLISDPSGTPATVLGADRPITVAQTYWRDIFETDPATSAPWLPSAVNAANMQMDRTT